MCGTEVVAMYVGQPGACLTLLYSHGQHCRPGVDARALRRAQLPPQRQPHGFLANITSWENSKAAEMEAQLKKMQEQLEKKKARCVEKLKNNTTMVHKEVEEKGAAVEARCGEEIVAAEEAATRYRAKGEAPKKLLFEALRGYPCQFVSLFDCCNVYPTRCSSAPSVLVAPMFLGCDYEHCLIVMDKPGGESATKQQMINCYIKTRAKVLGRDTQCGSSPSRAYSRGSSPTSSRRPDARRMGWYYL